MKHTTTLRNSLAKWFSLAAIISLFAFSPMKSSAQILCSANFQYSISGTTVQFWDSSYTQFAHTCTWTFTGNGATTTSYLTNPLISFNSSGVIYACLTIIDTVNLNSCSYCDTIYLGGGGGCQAYYTAANSGTTYSFQDQSSGNIASWDWDFGDGAVASGQSSTHTYAVSGVYQVCLTITDSTGSCSDIYCTSITVNAGGCSASYTATSNGGGLVLFTNTSTLNSATMSAWNFGDGSIISYLTNPTHTYTSSGSYVVCLSIFDSASICSDIYCDSIYVTVGSGSCAASFTATPVSGTTVAFGNTSTGNFTDAFWSFGDGTGVVNAVGGVAHTYSSNGTYYVCLTISDSNGICQSTSCSYVSIGGSTNNYSISGMISGNNSPIDLADVYLIQYDSLTQSLNLISTYSIGMFDSSYYYFGNLSAGSYLVKAAAAVGAVDYATLVPTYYNNSLFWSSASFVNVGPSQYGVNINMIQGVNPGGPGFIGGLVSQGANKMEAEGDPLSGIQIMLLDMSNVAVANTYSDVNGEYSFGSLAYGTYKVYAEILNKVTYPAVVTIDATTPSINNVAVIVNTNNVTTVTPYIDLTNIESALLYPNPAKGSATLNLNLTQAGDYTIQITDITGRLISAETVTLHQGENLVKLAVQNFDAGLYMVRVSDEISTFNMKLTVVK